MPLSDFPPGRRRRPPMGRRPNFPACPMHHVLFASNSYSAYSNSQPVSRNPHPVTRNAHPATRNSQPVPRTPHPPSFILTPDTRNLTPLNCRCLIPRPAPASDPSSSTESRPPWVKDLHKECGKFHEISAFLRPACGKDYIRTWRF